MQERRIFPRYHVNWPVDLMGRDGVQCSAVTCDLAVSGIGLHLDRTAVVALAQDAGILRPGDRLKVVLTVPADSGAARTLAMAGRVGYVRRLSQQRYQLGIWFADPDPRREAELTVLMNNLGSGHRP